MEYARKIRLLNKLLAHSNPHSLPMCVDAARGVETALRLPEDDLAPLGIFAKRILALYDPSAAVEVVELAPSEPLFALAPISSAVKRLAGHDRAYLVICGLGELARKTKKKYKNPLFGHSNHRGFYFQIRKSPAQSRDSFYISIKREKSFSFANGGGRSLVLNV